MPGGGAQAGAARIYSTCPQSRDVPAAEYSARIRDVAQWSEAAGCHGILVYTDNGILDPWSVAHLVVLATERLRPLVAVQPVYMHPYTVAKMISSLAYLHGRAIDLNWLAGGFPNDLHALGDHTPHDLRYARTRAYAEVVDALLRGGRVTLESPWHSVENLTLMPPLPEELLPGHFISGSSEAGVATALALGATPVRYPKPVAEEAQDPTAGRVVEAGIRVGLVARRTAEEAWALAHARFPTERRGQLRHQLAMKVSDSHWHRQLSDGDDGGSHDDDPYWLGPFKGGQTFCPYLVGSYDRVASEVSRYLSLGFKTFILDIPPDEDELGHARAVFDAAKAMA